MLWVFSNILLYIVRVATFYPFFIMGYSFYIHMNSLRKAVIPFSERKGYRLLKWVGKSLKTLFVRSNQETVRIIVSNIDHLWSEVSWILGYRARGVRI